MIAAIEYESLPGYTRYLKLDRLDDQMVTKARQIFDRYVDDGLVIEGRFEDDDWMLSNQKSHAGLHFRINELEYKAGATDEWTGCTAECFKECIKAYTVFQFGMIEISSLQTLVNDLCRLPKIGADKWAGSLDMHGYLEGFLAMLPGDYPARDMLIERIQEIGRFESGKAVPRKLAEFSYFFAFGRTMKKVWTGMSDEEKITYFPVYLWWNLTAILPLRVTEFLLIPRDCLVKKDDEWMLTIRRTRLKKGMERIKYRIADDYEECRYVIPESMAKEIRRYVKKTESYMQAELGTLFIPDENSSRGYLAYYSMQNRLKSFCDRYLGDRNYPVRLGDTRHLAMINLMLSGGSPVICRELAGHESVDISSNYYANLSSAVESIVYEHYHRGKGDAQLGGTLKFPVARKGIMTRVGNGYCDHEAVGNGDYTECAKSYGPDLGMGDCRYCPHYYPDNKGLFLEIKAKRKQDVDDDSSFLIQMIEIVRKGKGCSEDIASAMARLQGSAYRYAAVYNRFLEKEEDHGTT